MKIKSLFFSAIFIFASTFAKSQTYSISYTEISVMSLSVSISYSGSSYSSPYSSAYATLNTMQQRYDYYYGMINKEWGRLEEFQLLNSSNKTTLNNHKIDVRNYFAENRNNFRNVDWGRNGDFAIKIVNYISSIYNNSYIKSEISLLKAINSEYRRLKNNDPDNFHKSARYGELATVLGKLKVCNASEIGNLAVTYGLW